MKPEFLVSTIFNGLKEDDKNEGEVRQTRLWNPSVPLSIGHPFRWILESTEDGVRIRSLSQESGWRQNTVLELTEKDLIEGRELDLPQGGQRPSNARIEIRRARSLNAPYEALTETKNATLWAYLCVGDWVLEANPVTREGPYEGRIRGQKVFTLNQSGEAFDLKIFDPRLEKTAGTASANLSSKDLCSRRFELGCFSWHFAMVGEAVLPKGQETTLDSETLWFISALKKSGIALALASLLIVLWPQTKPDEEELIPEQYVKLVMTPQSTASEPSSASGSAEAKKRTAAAVSEAMRSKAVAGAVQGLLKGGVNRLLSDSKLLKNVGGSMRLGKGGLGRIGKWSAKLGGGAAPGKTNLKATGGAAVAGGVGYGKGSHAGVGGQGEDWLEIEQEQLQVQEGLSKDEVGRVIHAHLSEVRYCYEAAMVRSSSVEGRLLVAFTIGADGRVKSSNVKESSLSDPRLDQCLLSRLKSWQFPKPRGGVDVSVTYPFLFKTLGR